MSFSSRVPPLVNSACVCLALNAFPADHLSPTFPVPAGFRAELFASEPMFANPVAISVDVDGSVYVTETRRRKANALDIRQNADWLNHDLSFTNVAMKEAFYREQFKTENSEKQKGRVQDLNSDGVHDWRDLTVLSEVIYKLRDTNGDGRADESTIFADGFNTIVTDVAAGVLARGRDVYATVAPDLWKLTDHDGDGRADERVSLAHGFAVHIAYAGHNMHSPVMGTDGRIYWSIADIGSNAHPNEGAIFRIDPDGQNFEVFARGLRNPHEFVFNELGDMFTGDNDSDNGDRERWLHIVEGADYGWRNSWQYQIGAKWGARRDTYALWNSERLWHLWFPEQAAWLLPPAAHIGPGPCGMKFYPGGALDEQFAHRFLLAQFTGSPGSSSINMFSLTPNGATYDIASDEPFLTSVVPTGIDFAPDGSGLFFADWAGGWDLNDQGRIWRIFNPKPPADDSPAQTAALLAGGMDGKSSADLLNLLAHNNLNVRREAQFALATKGPSAASVLALTAQKHNNRLARIHALWGLEMIHRKSQGILNGVVKLLDDPDAEIRAQTAKMMGEGRVVSATAKLLHLLTDPSARVQFFAATALGKIGDASVVPAIEEMISANGSSDKHLRYAGIRALELMADTDALLAAKENTSTDVRLASVVALRRLKHPAVAQFLEDPDPLVVVEAARAINDVPINDALPELAALIGDTRLSAAMALHPDVYEWLARRVLNANFRLGQPSHAEALVAFAADAAQSDAMRTEAIRLLADWKQPNVRDHVVGAWRPLSPATRDVVPLKISLGGRLLSILAGSDALAAAATRLAGELGMELNGETLLAWAIDSGRTDDARITALELLAKNNSPQLNEALAGSMNASGTPPGVYGTALRLYAAHEPELAARELTFLFRYNLNDHVQSAFRALAGVDSTNLVAAINQSLDRLISGGLPPGVQLDVIEAAKEQSEPGVRKRLEAAMNQLKEKPLGDFALSLEGGNAARGRDVFFYKVETECLRCHKVSVNGETIGGDAAPDLTGIGKRVTREYLVSAIVNPNREFAEGYEQAVLTLEDGSILAGRILEESNSEIRLEIPMVDEEDFLEAASAGATVETRTITKSEISRRDRGLSGMPEGFDQMLTPFELRDLVEFLARQ